MSFSLNDKKVEIDENIIKLSNSNTSYDFSNQLRDLLNGENINNIDNSKTLIDYFNLISEAGAAKNSQRYKQLNKRINELQKHGRGIITISENPKDLWERLEVLQAASKEGHNNSIEEKTAILTKLLKLNQITHEDYKKFLR